MLFRFSASRSIAIFLDFLDEYRTVNVKRDKEEIPVNLSKFQYILMLDVIEHLKNPEVFMEISTDYLANS